MLKLEDLITDIDIRDITVFESALAHEKKNIGVTAFCQKYESLIEEFRASLPHMEFCFLLAYLEHLDSTFSYDETVKLDGYVLEPFDFVMYLNEEKPDLGVCWDSALPVFRNRGFLFSEIDEVV